MTVIDRDSVGGAASTGHAHGLAVGEVNHTR